MTEFQHKISFTQAEMPLGCLEKKEIVVKRSERSARPSWRGVQGPAKGPLVGVEGAKPPEAHGF